MVAHRSKKEHYGLPETGLIIMLTFNFKFMKKCSTSINCGRKKFTRVVMTVKAALVLAAVVPQYTTASITAQPLNLNINLERLHSGR